MSVRDYFQKLYKERKELALLEWTYLAIVIVSVVVAGIFALINQALGVSILIVPLVSFIAMSMNVVAWALIRLFAESFFPKEEPKTKPKNTKKK